MDAIPVQYRNLEQHFIVRGFHEACGNILTKSQQPRLSVLTLTYNHAPFIAQNIESVLSQQTSFPIQHIIADDASEDGTQEIISQYAAQYANIIPIFQKKRTYGPGNVRTLFDFARTEYVAICDGDDYFTDPTKLQTQVDFLEQNNDCALCFHVVRVIYEDNPDRERFYPPEELLPRGIRKFYYLSDLLKCNLIQTNSVVYRWRFSSGLPKWFRADCCPGDWYWHLLHAELGKIGFINKTMSVYRRHKQGIYYLSEVDRLKHRATMGLREIEFYNEVNIHFSRKYESILLDLINGVLADCLLYDIRNSADVSIAPVFPQLIEQFPQLVRHFLSSIETASRKNCKYERFER